MKNLLIFICMIYLFGNCAESSVSADPKFKLTAPNGETLAKNLKQVEYWTANVIVRNYGESVKFNLTGIEYYDIQVGLVAKIKYTVNGEAGHFLVGKNVPVNSENGRTQGCVHWEITCTGTECCTPTFNVQTQNSSCQCSNGSSSGCRLSARCLEEN